MKKKQKDIVIEIISKTVLNCLLRKVKLKSK